jgi:hypothetical protein
MMYYAGTPTFNVQNNNGGATMAYNGGASASFSKPSLNAWHHFAISRNTGTVRIFIDGAQVATCTDTSNFAGTAFHLGSDGDNAYPFQAYYDSFRITKGVGRYTAGFTVPAAAYPGATMTGTLTVGGSPVLTAATQTSAGAPYDLAFSTFGTPTASEAVFRFISPRAFTIPANLAGSIVKSTTAATGSTVFTVNKNGSQIATITFAATATVAIFSTQAAISVAVGDKITVIAPSTPDTTLADIDYSLVATIA